MRTLKLALAAVAAFAFNASAQTAITGMGNGTTVLPPNGNYQPVLTGFTMPDNIAFHAGGVAACDGCHVMHNASSGVAKSTSSASGVQPWTNVTNAYLLQGTDQSSTCLICHNGNAAGAQFTIRSAEANNPINFTPGGDFAWLRYTFSNSPGVRHGHNVVAADFNMLSDGLLTAPGGSFTATSSGRKAFACTNCHDPHGRYRLQDNGSGLVTVGPGANGLLPAGALPIAVSGSYGANPVATEYAVGAYRLLGGQYYAPASNASYPFSNDPPQAVAPTTYNRAEDTAANEVRVAYGSGMSEWCQNCHANIHIDGYWSGVAGLRHPAGSTSYLHATQIAVYNSYLSSGAVDTSGQPHYTSLVPFEQTDTARDQLTTNASTGANILAGPRSAVMCLSCHRAHATAFDSMLRWDQNATFLTGNGAYTSGNTDRSDTLTQAGYYNRPPAALGSYQRSLCNKCHGKD